MDLKRFVRFSALICLLSFIFSRHPCYSVLANETAFDELCRFEGKCLNCSGGGCDDMCQFYDNQCCVNTTSTNSLVEKWQYSCVRNYPDMYDLHLDCRGSFNGVYGVYMVTKCSKLWTDDEIRSKCENSSQDDLLSRIPVYDNLFDRLSFRNMYCAFCNWLSLHRLRFWTFDMMCNDKIQSNVGDSVTNFVPENCFIRLIYRQHRMCAFDVIENCVESEKIDYSLRNKCKNGLSQTVYVWRHGNVFNIYKNEFCAECNYETGALQCWAFQAFTCWPQDLPPYTKVNAMVDLSLYGNTSSKSIVMIFNSKCGDGVLYDPFVKSCMNVTCLLSQNTCISGKCYLVEIAASEFAIQDDSSLYFYTLREIIQDGRYFLEESSAHVCLDKIQYMEFKIKQVQQTPKTTSNSRCLFLSFLHIMICLICNMYCLNMCHFSIL